MVSSIHLGPLKLFYTWITSSTLDLAPIFPANTLLWADGQLQARGQYGRKWSSGLGRQLQVTLVLPPSKFYLLHPVYIMWHTLSVFVSPDQLLFKWPNDLYYKKKKLAGFLTHFYPDGRIAISFGLNTTFNQLEGIIQPLWQNQHVITRLELLERYISNFYSIKSDSQDIADFLTQHHIVQPGETTLLSSKPLEPLIFESIDNQGRALFRNATGERILGTHGALIESF